MTPVPFNPVSPASGEYEKLKPANGGTISSLDFSVKGSTVKGLVFHDRDNNGAKNGSDSNLAGATVKIVGPVSKEVTSAADGTFTTGSPILPSGSYTVTASKTNYDTNLSSTQFVNPAKGAEATTGNMGLHFATGSVEGDVYAETNGTPGRQAGEPPIAGAAIAVSGTYDSEPFELKVTSGADGTFSVPGVFVGANVTVKAAQPVAYTDGAEFTAAVGATTGNDQFTTVTVTKNVATGRFQFGETGATISGLTFSDCDGDGLNDPGEKPFGNREIVVTAAGFEKTTIMSGADGVFSVAGLPGGTNATLTPVTTSDSTAPAAKIVQPTAGGTVANVPFGYGVPGLCEVKKGEGKNEGKPEPPLARTLTIVAGKSTKVRKSRLSLSCQLSQGTLKSCAFTIQSKAKKGKKAKVLARGTATATTPGALLKVTLRLTKLGKAQLQKSPKSLRGIALVSARDETGQTLTATKPVRLRAGKARPHAPR